MSTPILLTGYPLGSSLGLVTAFEWLGQPYRLARVEMPAEMTTEEYGRVNGRRETPVLIREDGSVLTETLAIARWIEHRDHARRVSFAPGSRESERMWQLMAFLNSGFTGAFTPYWVAMEAQGMPEDARAFLREQGRQAVVERHGKLEAMLDDSPYLWATGRPLPTRYSWAWRAGPSSTAPSTRNAIRGSAPCDAGWSIPIRRCASRRRSRTARRFPPATPWSG